jgi:hypothetical protein
VLLKNRQPETENEGIDLRTRASAKDYHIEEHKRWQMRRQMFPQLRDDTVIFANWNQLYKVRLFAGCREAKEPEDRIRVLLKNRQPETENEGIDLRQLESTLQGKYQL